MDVNTLLEALPYIKRFSGSVMVIKAGGEVLRRKEIVKEIARDIALLHYVGIKPVFIHGGGKQVSEMMEKKGLKPKFVNGLRYTDRETLRIVKKGLSAVNSEILADIRVEREKAVSLPGFRILDAKMKKGLGFVGEVSNVRTKKISSLFKKGRIPVVYPIGKSSRGQLLNVNADEAAFAIASAMGANKLIFLSNVDGVLDSKGKLISKVNPKLAKRLISNSTVKGGMIPKLESGIKALRRGVSAVHMINGLRKHALLREIFSDSGVGTMLVKE